nr:MAG TPA: hypothetical protein [Caudoviricetes sp.]DAK77680.1 MAG TPA: hypothetical protein [Caudoviricetes sp.]
MRLLRDDFMLCRAYDGVVCAKALHLRYKNIIYGC